MDGGNGNDVVRGGPDLDRERRTRRRCCVRRTRERHRHRDHGRRRGPRRLRRRSVPRRLGRRLGQRHRVRRPRPAITIRPIQATSTSRPRSGARASLIREGAVLRERSRLSATTLRYLARSAPRWPAASRPVPARTRGASGSRARPRGWRALSAAAPAAAPGACGCCTGGPSRGRQSHGEARKKQCLVHRVVNEMPPSTVYLGRRST